MDQRNSTRERVKIILGCMAAFLLLLFVFYAAVDSNANERNAKSIGTLKELEEQKEVVLLESGKNEWKYLDTGSSPVTSGNDPLEWTRAGYSDSEWKTGKGSFGAVKGDLENQAGNRLTRNLLNQYMADARTVPVYYFRTSFQVEDLENTGILEGEIQYDDSALIYLNGQLVYALNNPNSGYAPEGYGAKKTVDTPVADKFTVSDLSMLREGENILAAELHQIHENSSDIYFDLKYLKSYPETVETGQIVLDGLMLETGDTEESIAVNWLSGVKGSFEVQWREKTENSAVRDVWNRALMGRTKTGVNGMYTYNAVLDGLTAGKQYLYRIKNLADGGESAVNEFQIPEDGGFTFCFAGDPQIGSGDVKEDGRAWNQTLETGIAGVPETAFIITAGDQIDSSDSEDAMEEFLAFRYPGLLKNIPTAVVRGNHESSQTGMDEQFERFEGSDYNYYFTCQNTLFYAINTNSKNYGDQLKRLRAAIKKTSPEWTVVLMHYSVFGGKDRTSDQTVMKARDAYAQAFSDLGVDLVLSGHDHLYSRSRYMNGETETDRDSGLKMPGEVLYVSGGSSTGSKFYKKEDKAYPYTAFTYQEKQPTLTFIKVEGNTLELVTRRMSDMEIVDRCEIIK